MKLYMGLDESAGRVQGGGVCPFWFFFFLERERTFEFLPWSSSSWPFPSAPRVREGGFFQGMGRRRICHEVCESSGFGNEWTTSQQSEGQQEYRRQEIEWKNGSREHSEPGSQHLYTPGRKMCPMVLFCIRTYYPVFLELNRWGWITGVSAFAASGGN